MKYLRNLIVTLVFLATAQVAKSCDLVLHNWQLKYYKKIPISAPIIPLSEINIIQRHFPQAVTDKILWVTKQNFLTSIGGLFINQLSGWATKAQWQQIDNNKSVTKIAKEQTTSESIPLIVGSDENFLKIAVFSDANSNFNCHQIVFAQESRIRCIFRDSKQPWAQEYRGQSCFSLVFYQQPRLENIISFNVYPINETTASLVSNVDYVEKLIKENKLKARPDLYYNPGISVIPELPE